MRRDKENQQTAETCRGAVTGRESHIFHAVIIWNARRLSRTKRACVGTTAGGSPLTALATGFLPPPGPGVRAMDSCADFRQTGRGAVGLPALVAASLPVALNLGLVALDS